MVAYSPFSGCGTFPESKKLWNPSITLKIANTDPGYERNTCIGYAPSKGRRCRNPMANSWLLMQTIEEIACLSPNNSPAIMSQLRAVAGSALCNRFHQNQAGAVVAQWQRDIQKMPVKVEPYPSQPTYSNFTQYPTQPPHSGIKQEFSHDQSLRDLQEQLRIMSERLAMYEEKFNTREHQGQEYERQQKKAAKEQEEMEEEKNRRQRIQKEKVELEKERVEKARKQKDAEEQLEKERLERIRLEKERLEKAKKQRDAEERLEKERLEKEKLEKEKREKEAKERQEKERLEKEKKEKEEKKQRDQASNERIRQNAQKLREQREREKLERERKEREEWEQSWSKYQEKWIRFRASTPTSTSTSTDEDADFRNAIPWPVKSGLRCDVKASNVREFLETAVPKDMDMTKLMRKECLKWHSDRIGRMFPASRFVEADRMIFEMICRVVTELLNKSGGK